MKAEVATIKEITEGKIEFIVPAFQRDYKWGQREWERLWGDITRAEADNGHFIGSLVLIDSGRGTVTLGSTWLVIDGQQRLTSLTLLLIALRDCIKESEWSGDIRLTKDCLDEQYLKNKAVDADRQFKLSLRRNDNETLHALVDGMGLEFLEGGVSRQVLGAYNFFKDLLPGWDLSAIHDKIAALRMVAIKLDRGIDDPQFVFESLNDTGIDLRPAEMVCNYLLMGFEEPRQNELYARYWSRLESHFRNPEGQLVDRDFSGFLAIYIRLKANLSYSVTHERIYDEFKQRRSVIQSGETVDALLQDMLRFAGYYAAISGVGQLKSPRATAALRSASQRAPQARFLMMRLCDSYDHQGTLSEDDFVEALSILENYMVRRAFTGWQMRSDSYPKVFDRIASQIGETPLEVVRREMTAGGRWAFPSDAEFYQRLQEVDLFHRRNICSYILRRLESYDNKETILVGTPQIEHIMPQTLTDEWREMLGEDWERVHSEWLHRLGNLTLTGYNPEMSNRSFHEKKTMEHGFNQTGLWLNGYVREQEVWTETQMAERGRRLAERALQIWPYPRV